MDGKERGDGMTNEQAKTMLKAKLECLKRETSGTDFDCNNSNCDDCSLCYEQGNMGEQKEALDMAIKALEKEPCEDAVNRQAVCEFLENHAKTYDDVRVRIGLKVGSSLVANPDNVPSVTPTRKKERWIPVSERLPKDKTYVLTTIKIPNRIAHVRSGWYEGGFIHNDNGDVWKATDMEVIAWMPLPDPYKAESEE